MTTVIHSPPVSPAHSHAGEQKAFVRISRRFSRERSELRLLWRALQKQQSLHLIEIIASAIKDHFPARIGEAGIPEQEFVDHRRRCAAGGIAGFDPAINYAVQDV